MMTSLPTRDLGNRSDADAAIAYAYPAEYLRRLHEQTAGARDAPIPLAAYDALRHQRLLITGDAGSGKTTFLRHLAFLFVRGIEDTRIDSVPFPILVSLPELGSGDDSPRRLIDFLHARNLELGWGFRDDYLAHKLSRGLAVLLLDDLGQAPSAARLIEKAVCEFPYSRLVVTSRPDGPSLPDFKLMKLPVRT